jgi:hypothetical protein
MSEQQTRLMTVPIAALKGERPVRRGHWQLLIVLGLFVCLATGYSLVLPLGEADDETDHFALVRFVAENGRPPLTAEERHAIGPKGDASPFYHSLVALLTQHVDLSELPSLPDTQSRPQRLIPTDGFRSDRIFHTEDEALPWRGIVLAWHLARLVSIPLGAATVVVAYVTALSLFPHRRTFAAGVAAEVAFIPRFIINSAVVNDDALAVPLVVAAVYCMVRIAQGDRRLRSFVSLGALIGLAAVAKYHTLIVVIEATLLLFGLAWQEARRSTAVPPEGPGTSPHVFRGSVPRAVWLVWLRRWGWLMLALAGVAGWWFAFLLLRFNQVTELGWWRGLIAPLGDPVVGTGPGDGLGALASGGLSGWNWAWMVFRSFWLSYDWQHIFAPNWVYWGLGGLCLLAMIGWLPVLRRTARRLRSPAGMRRHAQPVCGGPPGRLDVAVLVLHLLLFLAIIALRGWLKPAPETAQGRHLYPALTALSIFFVAGLSQVPGLLGLRWGKLQPASASRGIGRTALLGSVTVVLLALSAATWPLILAPHYIPYLPIRRTPPAQVPMMHRQSTTLAAGLRLAGYDLHAPEGGCGASAVDDLDRPSVQAGGSLAVTRYWYAAAPQSRDYLVRLCLVDAAGHVVICHHSQPVDGRYPMRAWETGYLIRDAAEVPLPACLPAGTYAVHMALVPLRLDTPAGEADATAQPLDEIALGRICVLPQPAWAAALDTIDMYTAEGRTQSARVDMRQLRQSLTLVVIRALRDSAAGHPSDLVLARDPADPGADGAAVAWLPAAPPTAYHCPNGAVVAAGSFVLHPGVAPGFYRPVGTNVPARELTISVDVRRRDFQAPATTPDRLAARATFAGAEAAGRPVIALVDYAADTAAREAGESIPITAYWQAQVTMNRPYVVSLYLLDPLAQVGGQIDLTLGGHYPNVLWAPGEYVTETYALPVRAGTPAGLYSVQLGLYDYGVLDGGQNAVLRFLTVTSSTDPTPAERLQLAQIRVKDPAEGTPPATPVQVELGGQIRLQGYDLVAPADGTAEPSLGARGMLNLALHWQATRRPAMDYTVFTQLVGPDGRVWGQQDNQPQGGRYPTTAWEVGQSVVDRYSLTLSVDAPRGEYRLLVGMYDLATGIRLPAATEDGTRLADDAILIATVPVR